MVVEIRDLDQAEVDDIAATLFWTLAANVGVHQANSVVIQKGAERIFEERFAQSYLRKYGYEQRNPVAKAMLRLAVCAEILTAVEESHHLQGVISRSCLTAGGRVSPAWRLDTSVVRLRPRAVQGTERFELLGRLCLRYPLPAVVVAEAEPDYPIFMVKNTVSALGDSFPMIMVESGCHKLGDNLFVVTGVLNIPTPNKYIGDHWEKIIPNSTRVVGGGEFMMPDGLAGLDVMW